MHFRKGYCAAAVAASLLCLSSAAEIVYVPGADGRSAIYRDVDGIVHIIANTETEVVFAQGWAHARDRFFQMDSLRRQASGTLGELLGPSALDDDVLLRTLGLRRAAERSLAVLSPEAVAALQAYAEGINAWLAGHPLPSEYAALELTSVEEWTPLDSVTIAKLLAFGLSFDLDVALTNALVAYQTAGAASGFDGSALFFEDLYRSAPFDPAATVPDGGGSAPQRADAHSAKRTNWRNFDSSYLQPTTLAAAADYLQRLSRVPIIGDAIVKREGITGSNEWGVAGKLTADGRPIIANDPHLSLDQPATFYQNHLVAHRAGLDVVGSSFAGVPLVVLGQNRHITWGATTNPMDVTDTFQEQLAPAPGSPFGLGTVTDGVVEPLQLLVLEFRANQIGDNVDDNVTVVGGLDIPPFALVVPRRNNGPVVSLDVANLAAVSIQYTGFGATRELDAFRNWNFARNLDDYIDGLQYFDFGSQNFIYADIDGNLAYFTSGELPLREDLQAGVVDGLPPFFIRDGTGGNEWRPAGELQIGQATPSDVLPFAEMPKLINPTAGYFVNANNDPAGNSLDNDVLNDLRPGGGIFYLNPGYAIGTRAGRITKSLRQKLKAGLVDADDMAEIQANVQLLDAEVFTPLITSAFDAASSVGAAPELAVFANDARIAEAATRLAEWDFSAPTGVLEGYDAADAAGVRLPPGNAEIDASIAITIYSVWRARFIANVIDNTLAPLNVSPPGSAQTISALRNMIDTFPTNEGVGASGIDFFAVSGVADANTRLAIKTLTSLSEALDLLAGNDFAGAFANSNSQNDYRWGRLHRIVLDHPLGEPYNLPSATGPLQPSFADLAGFAVDGGFGAVDASSHSVRAASSEAFRFGAGPVRRYVGTPGMTPGSIVARTSLPAGSSGVLGSEYYANLMERWLTNDTYPVRQSKRAFISATVQATFLLPAR